MKAMDLRIGNYFKSNIVQQVTIEHLEFLLNDEIKDKSVMQPIELTPDWLIDFGLTNGVFPDNEYFSIINDGEGHPEYGLYHDSRFTAQYIKYVHELQNLYFALTGTELELKQKTQIANLK